MKTQKLVLINPAHVGLAGLSGSLTQRHPPLSLAAVAGLTPDDWEIVIEDELWAPARFHADATLVGATAFTASVNRAYELLAPYRTAGIPTILGGIHAWACETEARKYAGSIVLNDAERIWWNVLSHAHCGLSPTYHGGHAGRFAAPRFDLLDARYEFGTLQFSRGCPCHCTFCSVPRFSGSTVRRAAIDDVLRDLRSVPQEKIFIADDNLYGRSAAEHAEATHIMQAISAENLGKQFVCQASLDVGEDDVFLAAARAAGVRLILIGIEAADTATLKSVGKATNLACTLDFRRIHAHGIGVLGAYVFGFDTDTPQSIIERARFMTECGADCSQMSVATPLPGTPFYEQLRRQNRLLYTDYPRDWQRHDFAQLVYLPKGFRAISEFYDCMAEAVEIAYNDRALKDMGNRCQAVTGSWDTTAWAYTANTKYAEMARLRAEWWGAHRSLTEK